MYLVSAKNLCGCFDLKEGEFIKKFDNKNEALEHTEILCKKYNMKFCGKHNFFYEIDKNTIHIKMKVVN
jgi:hypothetical protein